MASRKRRGTVRALAAMLACVFLFAATAAAQTPLQLFGQHRQLRYVGFRAGTVQAKPPAPTQPTSASFAEVTDEAARHVRIPQPVRRIVSLAPSLTETIYALGIQDRLVGDTDYCDYPADAQTKTKVGGAINPSLEQIVALRPDLVLVTKSLNRIETVRALDDLHVPAYATDPHTVEDVISSTERLAEVLGIPEAGQSLAQDLHRRLSDLKSRLAALPARRVLFVVWAEPLISAGKGTFIADALRLAGGISVIDSAQDWPQINLEEAVRLQPDVLVFAATHPQAEARDFAALAERPGWRDLDAVRGHRFAVISDAVNRPAPRLITAIEELARQLHPEAFSEKPQAQPVTSPGLQSRTANTEPQVFAGASTCGR